MSCAITLHRSLLKLELYPEQIRTHYPRIYKRHFYHTATDSDRHMSVMHTLTNEIKEL